MCLFSRNDAREFKSIISFIYQQNLKDFERKIFVSINESEAQ
jgi:hypothetical protein